MARDDSITVSFRLNLSREDDIEIQKFLLGDTMKICFGDKSKFIKSALIRVIQGIKRDEEREQAEYDARTNNMKVSDYVRYLILHGGRVDTKLVRDRRDLISQISGLCNNYNQMTRVANGCGYVFDSTMKNGNQLIGQIKELLQEVVLGWQ